MFQLCLTTLTDIFRGTLKNGRIMITTFLRSTGHIKKNDFNSVIVLLATSYDTRKPNLKK